MPRPLPLIALTAAVLILPLTSTATSAPAEPVAPARDSVIEQTPEVVIETGRNAHVSIDAPETVTVGTPVTISGRIPVGRDNRKGRKILLIAKEKGARYWADEDRQRTTRNGKFTLTAEGPDVPGSFLLQVSARRQGRDKAVKRTVTVTVSKPVVTEPPPPLPPTGPLGDPNDWTYISATGASMRWDPCQAIQWSYDPTLAPYADAESEITTAIAMIAEKTGYAFTRVPVGPIGANLLTINWSTPEVDPQLTGSVLGLGGPFSVPIDPARNGGTQRAIVGGRVTFDATHTTFQGGFGRPGWGQVMLHEISHALGLGHAAGREQVMAPNLGFYNTIWGAGDLTGLSAVGAVGKGCIDRSLLSLPTAPRTVLVAE